MTFPPSQMDLNDVFMTDPFLSLDNDLDDVSEVIRSNMIGEGFVTTNCREPTVVNSNSKGIFDDSRTPSPQYLHDSEVFVQHERTTYDGEQRFREKEIGHIVSLLQDDTMLNDTVAQHHHPHHPSHQQQQTHHQHNTTQSTSNEFASHHNNRHNNNNTNNNNNANNNNYSHYGGKKYHSNEVPNDYHSRLEDHHVTQNHFVQHNNNQQYFIDANASDVNFGAPLSANSDANSPMDGGGALFCANRHHQSLRDTRHDFGEPIISAAANVPSSAFMGGSGSYAQSHFGADREARQFGELTSIFSANLLENAAPMQMEGGLDAAAAQIDHDEMLICGGAIDDSSQSMLHSGLSDEMLHVAAIRDEMPHFGSTATASTTTSMPSPSLSDLFPAGEVFPPTVNSAHFYLDETSPPPPAPAHVGFQGGFVQQGFDSLPHERHHQLHYRNPHPETQQQHHNSFQSYQQQQERHTQQQQLGQEYQQQPNHQKQQPHSYVKQEIMLTPNGIQSSENDILGGNKMVVEAENENDSENQSSTKTELIRMLLEMSPTELETLRSSRNNSAVDIAASVTSQRARPTRLQHQKASTASLPPLDPPPPSTFFASQAQQQHSAAAVAQTQQTLAAALHATQPIVPQTTIRAENKKAAAPRRKVPKKHSVASVDTALSKTPTITASGFDFGDSIEIAENRVPVTLNGSMAGINFNGDFFSSANFAHAAATNASVWKGDESGDEDDEDTDTEPPTYARSHSQNSSEQPFPTSPTKRGPKTERRTAHNLIEKKYRCSINDRINHLKAMLASDETKLSKSATLRKAIEHINKLRAENADLARENRHLHAMMEAAGIQAPAAQMRANAAPLPVLPHSSPPAHRQAPAQHKFHSSESSSNSASPTNRSPPIVFANKAAPAVAGVTIKKPLLSSQQSQRISLCVFMFVMMAFNPISLLLSPATSGAQDLPEIRFDASAGTHENLAPPPVYSHHRTLRAISDDLTPFDDIDAAAALAGGRGNVGNSVYWFQEATIRRGFVWLLNTLVVVFVLVRLFVYSEPVADGRGSAWHAFLAAKQCAARAVAARNYREAQRQLADALHLLGRTLPCAGGVEEAASLAWQVVRHVLNGIWIGRWLARRRRSATQPSIAVCRSHAATALVCHQIHQLHLIGINGIELSEVGAMHLALTAVNLAESAGISRDGVTHRLRADIYINAALRAKSTCAKFAGALTYAYFMRRARRHVRKAQMVDGADVRAVQWIFHPLARKFFDAHGDVVTEILRGVKRPLNFPFSGAQISHLAKPMECLTSAFKVHLLLMLMRQLSTLNPSSCGSFTDFVEISHLLLEICTSPQNPPTSAMAKTGDSGMLDWGGGGDPANAADSGDELCTWWTHLITCGLYWRHGDNTHAQKHYVIVRKCPNKLLNNDLALAMGLAFCTRKMCFDDRLKKNFTDMVWMHAQKSFQHLEKDNFPNVVRKNCDVVSTVQKYARSITCEWIMTSLLDIWNHKLHANRPCWEQSAPNLMRRLYNAAFCQFEGADEFADHKKVMMFKVLGRALIGGNPAVTWRMLKALFVDENSFQAINAQFSSSNLQLLSKSSQQQINSAGHFLSKKLNACDSVLLQFQFEVLHRLRKDFCTNCNLILD